MRTVLVITAFTLMLMPGSGTTGAVEASTDPVPAVAVSSDDKPVKLEVLFNQAQEDIRNKDYASAEIKFRKVIEHSPELFNAYYNLYIILAERNRYAEADSLLSKTTNLKLSAAQRSEVFLLLGDTAERLDNQALALARYDSSIMAMSNNADALKNKARIYLVNEKTEEAFGLFRKAVILKYDDYLIHFGLGSIYRKKGDTAKAIEEYRISIQQNPGNWRSHMNLALAYSYSDMYDEAITEYKSTIALNPGYPDVWYDLGNAYRYKGLFDDMVSCYRKALELKPDFKEAVYTMSCYYAIKKDKSESLQWLKRAVSLDPDLKKKAQNDPDFQSLKDDKDFKSIVK